LSSEAHELLSCWVTSACLFLAQILILICYLLTAGSLLFDIGCDLFGGVELFSTASGADMLWWLLLVVGFD
jgi:hypothetical protein